MSFFLKQPLNKRISKYVLDVLFKGHFHIFLPRQSRTVQIVDFPRSVFAVGDGGSSCIIWRMWREGCAAIKATFVRVEQRVWVAKEVLGSGCILEHLLFVPEDGEGAVRGWEDGWWGGRAEMGEAPCSPDTSGTLWPCAWQTTHNPAVAICNLFDKLLISVSA